jgi:hypothetical protein
MSSPCYSCGQNAMDFSGEAQVRRIQRMISDNYTIIVLSIVSIIVLLFAAKYFWGELYASLSSYRKALQKQNDSLDNNSYGNKKKTEDDEEYEDDDEKDQTFDSTQYFKEGKKQFVTNMESQYNKYNKLKSEYIANNYSKSSDDVIDQSALYKSHDDYTYTKEKTSNS